MRENSESEPDLIFDPTVGRFVRPGPPNVPGHPSRGHLIAGTIAMAAVGAVVWFVYSFLALLSWDASLGTRVVAAAALGGSLWLAVTAIVFRLRRRLDGIFLGFMAVYILGLVALWNLSAPSTGPTGWRDEEPSWSPNGREIVFASNRAHPKSSTDQLYLMRADGTRVRQLTEGAHDASEPSFSPNGKRIVFAAGRVLRSTGHVRRTIELISARGTNRQLLTFGDVPIWSPDGRWIAFLTGRDLSNLDIIRPDGSHRRVLATNDVGWELAWSPDSKEIAFDSFGGARLYRVRINARRPIRVPRHDSFGPTITDIAWSPDGSKIAYVRGIQSCGCDFYLRHLWILDLKTHIDRQFRPVVSDDCIPDSAVTITWVPGPQSRLAVFAGKLTDLVRAYGTTPYTLQTLRSFKPPKMRRPGGSAATRSFLTSGSASPEGKRLLFVASHSDCADISFDFSPTSAIFGANLENGRFRQLTQRPR